MPVYSYICDCGHKEEVAKPVSMALLPHPCRCGREMRKDYLAMLPAYHDVPFDSVDFDLTGKPLVYHTRGQLKKLAKQHGCEVDFGQRSRERRS